MGGINKALISVGGTTIIDRTVKILRPLFSEIIVAGWPAGSNPPGGTRSVDDNYPGKGPLAGIEAAMKNSAMPLIFVFGGDMPYLSADLITLQIDKYADKPADVFVPRIGDLIEPLHSIIKCSAHSSLEAYLRSARKPAVRDWFRLVSASYLDLPGTDEYLRIFANINAPGDLIRLV
jgi:molybdopterin-guanine dinucleotide biosynthesis protein A